MSMMPATSIAAPSSSTAAEPPWSTKEKWLLISIINSTHGTPMHVSLIDWVTISNNLMGFYNYKMSLVGGYKPNAILRYSPGACYTSFKALEDEFLDNVYPHLRHPPGTCISLKFQLEKLTRELMADLQQKTATSENEAELEHELSGMGIDAKELKRRAERKAMPPAWQSYESRRSYPSPPPPPGVGPSNTSSSRSHRPDGGRSHDVAYWSSKNESGGADSGSVLADVEVSPPTDPVEPQVSDRNTVVAKENAEESVAAKMEELEKEKIKAKRLENNIEKIWRKATEITPAALVADTEITCSPKDDGTIGHTKPFCELSPKFFPRIHKQRRRRNPVQKNGRNVAKRRMKVRWGKRRNGKSNGTVKSKDKEEESDEKQMANKIFGQQAMQRVAKENEEESVAAKVEEVEKEKMKAKKLEKNIEKIWGKSTSRKYISSAITTRRTRNTECEESEVHEKVEVRVERSLATQMEDTCKVARVWVATRASKRAHVRRRVITRMEDLEILDEDVQRKTRGKKEEGEEFGKCGRVRGEEKEVCLCGGKRRKKSLLKRKACCMYK